MSVASQVVQPRLEVPLPPTEEPPSFEDVLVNAIPSLQVSRPSMETPSPPLPPPPEVPENNLDNSLFDLPPPPTFDLSDSKEFSWPSPPPLIISLNLGSIMMEEFESTENGISA